MDADRVESPMMSDDADNAILADRDDPEMDEDVPGRPSLKTPEDALQFWNTTFQQGNMSCHHFREWWRRCAPKLLSPVPSMDYQAPNSHIDEDMVQAQLIRPLEVFCCDGDPEVIINDLSKLDDPPSQCGKLFKTSEPTYTCRDCSHDPTCVLCVDCFKNSEHRFHRYKMCTSSGGGFCDCGDSEAWNSGVHCAIHALGATPNSASQDPISRLPPHIGQRATCVFKSVVKYAYEMLTADILLNLPADLTFKDDLVDPMDLAMDTEDSYCTVVFNDEVHTFNDVINTLPRAVDCDRIAAIGFATLIDRDGRAIVKCSGFQTCNEAKRITERITSRRGGKPLKVSIIHSHVIAHQNLAIRLLGWLQNFLTFSAGFRALFCNIALEKDSKEKRSLVEMLCRRDTVLWKSARSLVHHLLMSGMLVENEARRRFACEFTKSYGHMMKEFILDDHEHTFSIASLSVQLFTVPTLAHHLIAHEDVLAVLLRTFMSEFERQCNDSGKIEFQRNISVPYRRTWHILSDLKYLLTSTPEGWDDSLRRGFLHGCALHIIILAAMQGMDQQVRQVTHHVEHEHEWENAFNMHVKVVPVSSLIGRWCGTDLIVFIKAVRMILKKIHEVQSHGDEEHVYVERTLQNFTTKCIDYEVTSRPVSVHLPLTRLLAAMSLHMGRFGLTLESHEFSFKERPSIVEMMEPALRVVVLSAQVQAGMWRRNGYSLVDQVRIYRNASCRREMFDQDVILLQLAAAHSDPDEFLIHLLNKFQLINWADADFDCSEEDSIRQITTIVEEFLGILITILGERYTPGIGEVTADESLKKEIIQLLCVGPLSHSALNRALSEDVVSRETGMEKVIDSIAVFKRPSGPSKGLYELKDEFYDEYNEFFYHYSREEQSMSEEAQRKRKKAADKPQCNPPPKPPPFTEQFRSALRIMSCDVFLHIVSVVLQRADNLKKRCFSESQVQKVLHLVALSLHEEERGSLVGSLFTERSKTFNILGLLQTLVGNQRIDSHRDLLVWVLRKWKCLLGDELSTDYSTTEERSSKSGYAKDANTEEKGRKAMAAASRAKLMAKMNSAMKNFVQKNSDLFDETSSGLETPSQDRSKSQISAEIEAEESMTGTPVALGMNKSPPVTRTDRYTCILCQEEEVLTEEGKPLVMAAFVQKSTVLSRRRHLGAAADATDENPSPYTKCPVLLADMPSALHTSSCGHVMHSLCWQTYHENVVNNERQRSTRFRHPHSFDIDRNEFLCPLCRCISNTIMPLLPQFHVLQPKARTDIDFKFSLFVETLLIFEKYTKDILKDTIAANETESSSSDLVAQHRHLASATAKVAMELEMQHGDSQSFKRLCEDLDEGQSSQLEFSLPFKDMVMLFFRSVIRNSLGSGHTVSIPDAPPLVWQTCAYTIHSTVWSVIEQGKSVFSPLPSRQSDCLRTLVGLCGLAGTCYFSLFDYRCNALPLLCTLFGIDKVNACVLEFDAFSMLVAATFALRSLFSDTTPIPLPCGNAVDQNLVHLLLVLNIVQILLTKDEFSHISEDDAEGSDLKMDDADAMPVLNLLQLVRESVGFATEGDGSENLKAVNVWNDVKQASLPFLRCCALLHHHVTSVPLPQYDSQTLFLHDEFDLLMDYFGLPNKPSQLFPEEVFSLAVKWSRHPNIPIMLSPATSKCTPVMFHMTSALRPALIDLPHDYSDLIHAISNFTCPKAGSASKNMPVVDSRVPAMCLVCGTIVCSQSFCCEATLDDEPVGQSTEHADRCSAGNGIFLRIRECKIVLLSGRKKGCFYPPPYLDEYGETDMGLRRGNPLTLSRERYRKLQQLWLNHAIPEEVSHVAESNPTFITTLWNRV